ncbi:MAG: hypothetical protein KAI71_01890 [Candidatus Pacebacteria bacterium]|nr:hypothetical protein [Candidatus Paceibacterota bacterium]
MNLNLVRNGLFLMAIILFLAHISERIFFNVGYDTGLFNLDVEKNVPSIYSTLLLGSSGFMLILIATKTRKLKRKFATHWLFLGIVFIFLMADEFFAIHETLVEPIRKTFNTSGLLYFAWIIPYAIFIVILFLIYLKFLRHLPKYIFVRFIASGTLYIFGGIIIESFGGKYIESRSWQKDDIWFAMITFEEMFEIIGISLFLYTLLVYIQKYLTIKEIDKTVK